MRHQILGRDQQCVVTSYEIALMKAAPQKIIPRRISRGQQRASQVSEASADKRDAAVGKQPFLFER